MAETGQGEVGCPDLAELALLSQKLSAAVARAEKGRRLCAFFKVPMYLGSLLYLLFAITLPWFGVSNGWALSLTQPQWIFPFFIIIYAAVFGFSKSLAYFSRLEDEVIAGVVRKLYPESRYYNALQRDMSETIIRSSGLFPQVEAKGQMPGVKAYGTLIIEGGSGELNVADIGVSYGLAGKALQSNPITAYFRLLYRALLKPLFNSRVESAMFNFRGMFCWAKLNKALPARILILPDHLEDKIGFLAHSVQALRPGAGERLVKLEDSEFERYFAVYADDEVAARYILTPLVMRRLTELREHFRQDLMLSVGGRGFYFAAPMSDGFFCLRGNALKDRNIAGRIYFGINIVRAIFTQLTDFPGNQ